MKNLVYTFILLLSFQICLYSEDLCNQADYALSEASIIRNLKILESVPCEVENKATIRMFLLERIEEEFGSKIQLEGEMLKVLKLIPENSDYKELILKIYLDQIAGYYDNLKKRFVMADWLGSSMQIGIAVHEQTHSLQDQHYNLTKFLSYKNQTTDEVYARSALVEGDASAVMYDWINSSMKMPPLKEQPNVNTYVFQNVLSVGFLANKHKDAKNLFNLMIFPYTSGLRFVHNLLQKGSYKEVDKAFKSPPKSTEEILHPEKYGKKKEFSDIDLTKLGICEKQVKHSDTLGEFFISNFLKAIGIEASVASSAASGWGGDKFVLLDNSTFKWIILFDSNKEKNEFKKSFLSIPKKFRLANFNYENKPAVMISNL